MKVHRYGETSIVSSIVRHRKGPVCASIPKRDWEFPLSSIRLIGEQTTPGGPIFDYYFIFVAGEPPRMFQIPMESLETIGISAFFTELEAGISGRLISKLANSTTHANRVMWPEELADQSLFDYLPDPRGEGVLGMLFDRIWPRYCRCLSAPLQTALDIRPEWAA